MLEHNIEWRPVAGFEDRYEVSSIGGVRRLDPDAVVRVMHPTTNRDGYGVVVLYGDQKRLDQYVHRLVCRAFHGEPGDGQVVRHLNGDPGDNRRENLSWGTQSENILDAVRHGTHYMAQKSRCKNGHEFTEENTARNSRGRSCRTCHRESEQIRRDAKRSMS